MASHEFADRRVSGTPILRMRSVRRSIVLGLAVASVLALAPAASAGTWSSSVPFTEQVASSPFKGGGYPVPEGSTAPLPGTCRLGDYNANRSESWIAVEPGTENLVGTSKVFFEKYSTFYMFHNGSYAIPNGVPADNNIIQGYECVTTGSQETPPSWTNNTDPTVAFDSTGRAYSATLPFNMWWGNFFNPDAGIGVVYSDDLGRNWVKGNGGALLDHVPNQSSKTLGGVEDKQWLAVNHFRKTDTRDDVFVAWAVFNGSTSVIKYSISHDRGQTFTQPRKLTVPSNQTGPSNTFVYPAYDKAGDVYIAFASFPACCSSPASIHVTRSEDGGETWSPFVEVADGLETVASLPNTTFRDGILEHFAASPTHPGHLYLVYEAWDGTQMDVKFTQSTDFGETWDDPITVNDNLDAADVPTDQFQPQVAAGPRGAVAVNFYDRRQACPDDPSVLPANVGRENLCIDVSLQAFKDDGSGAVKVGGNVRVSKFTWDPEQPRQKIDGIDQYACAGHSDPCPDGTGFIGDYFGLAISQQNVYTLAVSTHYPSGVTADPPPVSSGGPVYYQQQVLETVSRAALGI
jgi:hypothetical protein